jgi:hypothetical protein
MELRDIRAITNGEVPAGTAVIPEGPEGHFPTEIPEGHPEPEKPQGHNHNRRASQTQTIVIEQRTPRGSGTQLVRAGSKQGGMATQGHRRSGSVVRVRNPGGEGMKDPRASGVSVRSLSTRERVVVVDGRGVRREYYR